MANRFRQSMPPTVDDVYRGLPIGPGGVEPFVDTDRGRARSGGAARPRRRSLVRAIGSGIERLIRAIGASRRQRPLVACRPSPLAPGCDRI